MAMLASFESAWQRSDAIFDLIEPDAFLEQPIALRQPFIFYLGHLPAFSWNQLREAREDLPSLEAGYEDIFARGIDPVGVDAYVPAAPDLWPGRDAVLRYRDGVRDRVRRLVSDEPLEAPAERRALGTVLEHELMHQETLLYMVQQLGLDRMRRPAQVEYRLAGGEVGGRAAVPAGRAVLGARQEELPFGWDNEFPRHEIDVPAFVIDRTPVTNGEMLDFVAAGGFEREALWRPESWAWRVRRGISAPPFWRSEHGRWLYRTLFDELPLDEVRDWPVSVSWTAGDAFARWRGARLPTEPELHRAAYGTPEGELRPQPWGAAPPGPSHGNFGFRSWSPAPVGAFPEGASAWGVLGLAGDGWEWTSSPFGPFPGFRPMPNYAGYSQDFFDGQHFVMLGGSWATDDRLLRRSFRNWFQPHYPYVFAQFRCVHPD